MRSQGLAKRDGERLNSELFPGALEEADEADRRVARKRAYPTEDERRLGLCLSYVKRFKASNPGRLQEIAADFDLLFA
uniref:Helix-turn-helix domain-containing protein n=1 Tax=Ascaris lumbricoides TaxID=6252 RepID=A0A0M3IU92_ASCLU